MKATGLFLALLLVLAPFAHATPVKIGTVMEGFTLPNIEGQPTEVKYDKKVNVVSFWVSSCSLCKEELRILNELSEEYSGKDLGINVVSTDFGGPRMVKIVLKQTETVAKVPIVFDQKMEIAKGKFGATSFPILFVLDKTGKVVFYMDGFQEDSEERLKSEIDFRMKAKE